MLYEFTTPSPSNVMIAANNCNSILKNHSISHAFMGGFVMNHLNENRPAESLDLEIRKPMFVTWDKIMGLFKKTGHYHVMAGSNADMMTEKDDFTKRLRIRLVDIISGVQISIFERSPWSSIILQSIGGLPAHSSTELFISKVKCCGSRDHLGDLLDLAMLYNLHRNSLDEKLIRKRLTSKDGARAVRRYYRCHWLLPMMQQLKILPKWYDPSQEYERRMWHCF